MLDDVVEAIVRPVRRFFRARRFDEYKQDNRYRLGMSSLDVLDWQKWNDLAKKYPHSRNMTAAQAKATYHRGPVGGELHRRVIANLEGILGSDIVEIIRGFLNPLTLTDETDVED